MESLRSSVIALAFVALPGFLCGQTISSSYDNYRVLTVSGDAEIRVSPDLVLLSLGVDTRQPKLRQARVENDSAIQAVTQALRSLGVNADDIHTDYSTFTSNTTTVWPTPSTVTPLRERWVSLFGKSLTSIEF